MDHHAAQDWLDAYVAAWLSYDRAQIEALFTEDVRYRYQFITRAPKSAAAGYLYTSPTGDVLVKVREGDKQAP